MKTAKSLTDTKNSTFHIRQLTMVGLMTAVICLLGPIAFNIPFVSPVPISLGMLGIYLATSILGMKLGTLSVVIYILLGFAGVPVFTNFTGGASKLLGPTGGYIIGYIFMALICGFFINKWESKPVINFLGMVLGTAVCYMFGTAWLAFQMSKTFPQALMIGVIPYIPFDLVKLLLALVLGGQVRKRLKKAGLI